MNTAVEKQAQLAAEAGFKHAAEHLPKLAERATRLAQAYEFYRFVTEEQVESFKTRLRQSTMVERDKGMHLPTSGLSYDTLAFESPEVYAGVPPTDVLLKVKEARDRKIFDTFEVAHIVTVREVVDPIVFGRVEGCTDRFYVAQRGEDVRITDLIEAHEG